VLILVAWDVDGPYKQLAPGCARALPGIVSKDTPASGVAAPTGASAAIVCLLNGPNLFAAQM
jgi:hypothetical protein